MTIFIGIILAVFLAVLIFPQFWLSKVIAVNFSSLIYILLPLFIIMFIAALICIAFGIRYHLSINNAPIIVTNNSEIPLKAYINTKFIGDIPPGKKTENKVILSSYESYLIQVRDNSGSVFYNKELDLDELDKIDWTITINQ